MKRREDPESLAFQIADGHPIEWDAALKEASSDEERRLLRHLRLVESVAHVHRSSGSWLLTPQDSPTITGAGIPAAAAGGLAPASGVWGPLELRGKLGEGGFGEVYKAFDPRLDREVALKLLKTEATTVIAEGRLLARLRHPNIVAVYGAEIHDGRVGIWMELIRGRSLEQLLATQGPFGAKEAALIGIDLCRALAAAHRAGVLHRDVKAQNALREEGGRILLTDFGASVEMSSEERRKAGTISGTPFYMASELFRGAPATQRSDVFSLGVLLYRLVTGAFPIQASSWNELRDKHARREARLLRDQRPDLPEGFVAVVERAMAWEPEARFATAGEMEQALAHSIGSAGAPSAAAPVTWLRRHQPLALAGVGLLAVAAVAIGLIALSSRRERSADLPRPPAAPLITPAPPAAPATASYTVEAALYRTTAGSARRDRLEPEAQVALGDRLSLEVKASIPLHVYVIDEDEAGHAYALFPLPGLAPGNPLPPGVTHRLPGSRDGNELSWTVDTAGGREHIMIVASPDRLVEFEAEMNALARPGQMAVPIPDQAKVKLRGIGGLESAPALRPGASAGRLFEMAERLAVRSETVTGVWMRRIDLENPR